MNQSTNMSKYEASVSVVKMTYNDFLIVFVLLDIYSKYIYS